ncbi:hypothetical protein [Afipia sp. GAS231]|uniref:hypothetical protein n=1 Tax=Afipia sp. GAS231 TaxID=1882747 RepID=UPI0012F82554|nr:hypothetical protein [Afipia sp. GAS231]
MILLVAPIAVVQAPDDLLAHRGVTGDRDREALLGDNLAAFCLDREMFRSERQASIGRPRPAYGHSLKELNSI